MFMFLPASLDRKEEFLQWKDNVHLHPIDISIDDIKNETSLASIDRSHLDAKGLRDALVPGFYKVMKKVAELTNQNLIRNSEALISNGGKADTEKEILCIDHSFKGSSNKFPWSY